MPENPADGWDEALKVLKRAIRELGDAHRAASADAWRAFQIDVVALAGRPSVVEYAVRLLEEVARHDSLAHEERAKAQAALDTLRGLVPL